ncbi:unnamed protein product, partial [Prorocentrum cordatum]
SQFGPTPILARVGGEPLPPTDREADARALRCSARGPPPSNRAMAGRRRLALAAACVAAVLQLAAGAPARGGAAEVLPGAGAEAAAPQAACAAEEAEEAAALRTHLVQVGRRPWRGPARAAAAADGPRPHLGGAASLAGRGAEAPPPQAKTFLW